MTGRARRQQRKRARALRARAPRNERRSALADAMAREYRRAHEAWLDARIAWMVGLDTPSDRTYNS